MKISTKYKSPNFNERIDGAWPEYLIIHCTECDFDTSIQLLTQPRENPVSSHYLIDTDGNTYQLVDNEKRAWHAGRVSHWRDKEALNSCSIGIEIVNPGRQRPDNEYTPAQMDTTLELCQMLMNEHDIHKANVLAHSDIAPHRKEDPGEHFDWTFLADNGVGIYAYADSNSLTLIELQQLLSTFGYQIDITGDLDEQTVKVIKAFQMHFDPQNVNGLPHVGYGGLLKSLISQQPQIINKLRASG